MKKNILNTMKQFAKYICAVVMLLGMSVSAWGDGITFSPTSYSSTIDLADADGSFKVSISGSGLHQYTQTYWAFDNYTNPSENYYFACDEYNETYGSTSFSKDVTVSYLSTDPGEFEVDLVVYYWLSGDDNKGDPREATFHIALTIESDCDENATFTTTGTPTTTSSLRSTSVSVNNVGLSSLGATGCSITSYGYCWGTSANPTTSGSHYEVGTTYTTTGTAFGSYSITGLTANQKYYIRPYATNGNGTAYGPEVNVTTLQRYTITYNKNDGSGASATEYKDHGISYTISSNKYSRSGYTLVKWHTLAAGTGGTDYAKGASYTTDAALSLHAVWGGTISFNNNGGSSSMSSEIVVSGDSYELPSCTFTPPSGKKFKCWAQGAADGTERAVGYSHTVAGDITFYAVWRDEQYTDYKFSCADWSFTGPSGDTVFITSTASKTVRSQEAFHVTASGLPASTALTFTTFPANTRYAFKKADGSAIETDTYGKVNTDFYVFYTPTSGDTGDGLDEITKIYVSVTGEPRKDTLDTKTIIGRHLPTNFVIAAKKDGKWWAMPSDMTTGTPSPVEIAVDDADNPSIAYTATINIYSIAQPAASEYIRLKMNGQSNYPLFGSSSEAGVGKSSTTDPDKADIGDGYLWKLVQKRATGLSDPKEAKYLIYCKNNSSNHLRLKATDHWGLYNSGIEELRIIPASSVVYTESEVVAWGQKKLILEVALPTGATQARAKIADGSWSVNKSVATTTGTSVKGTATKYNYTLDFTSDGFDFAANEGKMLIVELLNAEGTALRATSVLIPRIIAADRTINKKNDGTKGPWNTEVHVLPGDTLFIDADTYDAPKTITIKELNIYPGATVNVVSGKLIVTTLILRNGWDRLSGATNKYDVARLYLKPSAGSLQTTNTYMDWYIDFDQYYPVAVPWKVTIANMSYKNSNTAATAGTNVKLRYYDGASRAANVQTGVGESVNWKEYGATGNTDIPTYLIPSLGYAMTAKRPTGKAFSIVRMPLTIPADSWITNGEQGEVSEVHKDQVSLTAHGNASTPSYAQGWNLVANPYMSLYEGNLSYAADDNIQYANILDVNFKEYDQLPIETTKLKPSSAFLVQAPKDGTVTFGTANRKASAPSYQQDIQAEQIPTQKAYIVLASDEAEDMMGILVSDKYSAEYELNADLEKLLGDGKSLRTYMHLDDMKMAYLAINKELAQNWIPVSVRIEKEGEHSFSMHRASTVSELKGVYLIDYQTGETTNLLEDSYPFYSTAGTINGRFAINAIVGPRDVPTELDIVRDGQEGTGPIKFIYHDKVFILHQGVIYDSTGKKVKGGK